MGINKSLINIKASVNDFIKLYAKKLDINKKNQKTTKNFSSYFHLKKLVL